LIREGDTGAERERETVRSPSTQPSLHGQTFSVRRAHSIRQRFSAYSRFRGDLLYLSQHVVEGDLGGRRNRHGRHRRHSPPDFANPVNQGISSCGPLARG